MARVPGSVPSLLAEKLLRFRIDHNLTQADLAERYGISGPAVFKFEKGYVTPSLRLWLKVAADLGLSEKEAVLTWVKEKIPAPLHRIIDQASAPDLDTLASEIQAAGSGRTAHKTLRNLLKRNPDVSPSLKALAANDLVWNHLKPTSAELTFLMELDQVCPRMTVEQMRDAVLLARDMVDG